MPVDHIARAVAARPPRLAETHGPLRRAAVALVFAPGDELLFIRRSEREGDPWSGHMAFPGGRMDPTDPTILHAAVRETWEEVGLQLDPLAHLVGELDELPSPAHLLPPRLVIRPYVFAVQERPELRPNHEVAGVYWFALDRLLRGEGRGSMSWPLRGSPVRLPVVHLEDANIWGLTLRIVDDLLERLRGLDPATASGRGARP